MKTKIIFSLILIFLILIQFSSAAILPHDIKFEITKSGEEYNPQRVIVYPMLDVTWYRASGAIWTPAKPSEMWAKICDKNDGFCGKKVPNCRCDDSGEEANDWKMIITPDSKINQEAISWLQQNTDSGTMPVGLLPFFRDVYNPFIEENTFSYLSSDGPVLIGNNGEINNGIIRISDAKRNLKNIIYPNDRTNRKIFLQNATIDFNNEKINLDVNGEYDYGITKSPCGSKLVAIDSITIKKVGEGNLEIPYSPGALNSCSSFVMSLNEYRNYENNIFKNFARASVVYLTQLFSGTSKVCVKSDTRFQEYYSVCNNDYTPITIIPTDRSSFVLHFNEGETAQSLANVFCGSKTYSAYANYGDPTSSIAKPNIRLNNIKCFKLALPDYSGTYGSVVDLAVNSEGEAEFQEKVYVSNEGDLMFNPNPTLDWGSDNRIAYGEKEMSSENGITTLGKFSMIDPLNDNLIDFIRSV